MSSIEGEEGLGTRLCKLAKTLIEVINQMMSRNIARDSIWQESHGEQFLCRCLMAVLIGGVKGWEGI